MKPLVLVAVLLVGCSSSSGTPDSQGSPTPLASASASPTASPTPLDAVEVVRALDDRMQQALNGQFGTRMALMVETPIDGLFGQTVVFNTAVLTRDGEILKLFLATRDSVAAYDVDLLANDIHYVGVQPHALSSVYYGKVENWVAWDDGTMTIEDFTDSLSPGDPP